MTTALELMQKVFRRAQFSNLPSFTTSQQFPGNIALDVLQRSVEELNTQGRYNFMLTSLNLTYGVGTYTYTMSSLAADLDGESITKIETTATNHGGELTAMEVQQFRRMYRYSPIQTVKPTAWTDYGNTLELNSIPDQDYSMKLWYYATLSVPTAAADTLDIPTRYEGVLGDLCYAYLLEAHGREDALTKYQIAINQAKKFLAAAQKKRSRATVMPGAF